MLFIAYQIHNSGATSLHWKSLRLCLFGVIDGEVLPNLTFPSPVLFFCSVCIVSPPELLPGALVYIIAAAGCGVPASLRRTVVEGCLLPPQAVHDLSSILLHCFPPGPSLKKHRTGKTMKSCCLPGVEELPEEELPPVQGVESESCSERKELETIP